MAREWITEKLLQFLRDGKDVTVAALAQSVDRPRDQVVRSLVSLAGRGLVVWDGEQCRLTDAGRLAVDSKAVVRTGAAGRPRRARVEPTSLRARAWKALRMEGGKSTITNLLSLLATDGDGSPAPNLAKYFKSLCRAGIMSRLERRVKGIAPTSNGFVVWVVIRDLGPRAPVCRDAQKQVFDPNSKTIYPFLA